MKETIYILIAISVLFVFIRSCASLYRNYKKCNTLDDFGGGKYER